MTEPLAAAAGFQPFGIPFEFILFAAMLLGVKTAHPSCRATSSTWYSPPMFTVHACWGAFSPRAERIAARW